MAWAQPSSTRRHALWLTVLLIISRYSRERLHGCTALPPELAMVPKVRVSERHMYNEPRTAMQRVAASVLILICMLWSIITYKFYEGTVAGFVECMASYPLDTIKTRIQAQPGAGSPMRYFLSALKEDGVRSLYRGVSSRIAASMIAASVMFGANGTLKELFHADSHKPLTVPFMAAAAGTGILEAYVYCPLEVIKTRMQVARCSPGKVTVWSMGVQLYREHGPFKGLYRGLSPMVLRDSIGNTIYFGSYELCKQAFASGSPGEEAGVLAIAMAGGVAGGTYSAAVHPLDTVKSLIQADSMETPEYRGVVHGFRRAVAHGGGGFKGFVSLYRGLSPSVMRSSVGNAVLFLTFEAMLDTLGR